MFEAIVCETRTSIEQAVRDNAWSAPRHVRVILYFVYLVRCCSNPTQLYTLEYSLLILYHHAKILITAASGGTEDDFSNGTLKDIYAPADFLDHAVSENVYAGNAMGRRAVYMYGESLDKSPTGQVGTGLGMATSTGVSSLIPPTVSISSTTGDPYYIGGTDSTNALEILFQVTPGTEAPSEMNFYFPQYRALCMAENATHTLHNIQTLRGALVRDARVWSRYWK